MKYFWRVYYYFFPPTTIGECIIYIERCRYKCKFPSVSYNKIGNFLVIWIKDEESYCETSKESNKIEVYKSCKTGNITGYKIHNL